MAQVLLLFSGEEGERPAAVCTFCQKAIASEETAIRLVLEGNTLTPQLDNSRPGDDTFDYEGRLVLMLDSQVSQVLDDSTLDIEATEEGPKLILLPLH